MRRKEREKELEELQKKDKRKGRVSGGAEALGESTSAVQSRLSQQILLPGTHLPQDLDRNQVHDLSQYQLPMQDMGDSNFGFSILGGESTMGFSHFAAAAYSGASIGDSVPGGHGQGGGYGQGGGHGLGWRQGVVLPGHRQDSAVSGKNSVTENATSMSESGSAHDKWSATVTVAGGGRGTGQTDQTLSMPPPHAPYPSSAGTLVVFSSSSAPSSSALPSASTSALLTPASIAKALSKVPPFARAGLKKQLELQYSQQLLKQLLHGGAGAGTGSGSGSGGSLIVEGDSGDQMQPLNQAERTEMLGNQWETHRQKVCTISSSSLLSAIASFECLLDHGGCEDQLSLPAEYNTRRSPRTSFSQ